jgi:Subtilase family
MKIRQRDKIRWQQQNKTDRLVHLNKLKRRQIDGGRKPFEIVDLQSREVMAYPGELLARSADIDAATTTRLKNAGWKVKELTGLDKRVVRLTRSGIDQEELRRLRRSLGFRSSLSYVLPNRVIIKGDATPNTAGPLTLSTGAAASRRQSDPTIAVIDTGISAAQRTDGWLTGLETSNNVDPLDVYPTPNRLLDAAAGHGTFVAGLCQQIDPGLHLTVHRVLDTDGLESEPQVASELVRIVRATLQPGGKLILNLSFGTDTDDGVAPIALSEALALIREFEHAQGGEVLLVAAAGNDGTTQRSWPAAFADSDDKVVAVAALDSQFHPVDWSTHGPWVTCSSWGDEVVSTFVTGTEDPDIDTVDPQTFGTNSWAEWTGTSFSTPKVAAQIARIAQRDGSSLVDALAKMLQDHRASTTPNPHPDYGVLLNF